MSIVSKESFVVRRTWPDSQMRETYEGGGDEISARYVKNVLQEQHPESTVTAYRVVRIVVTTTEETEL